MDFMTGTFIRFLILAAMGVFEIAILFSIGKHGSRGKNAAAVIVPVLLLFCMFLQGAYRRAPIDKSDLINIAKEINQIGVENYPIGVYGDEQTGLSVIITDFIDSNEDLSDLDTQIDPIAKLLSTHGTKDGFEYYITPITSDRPQEGFYMHQGYDGYIYLRLSSSETVKIDYSVYRNVDEWFGFLFAAPVVKQYRLSETLNSEHLAESYQYYLNGLYWSTYLTTLKPADKSNCYTLEFELNNSSGYDLKQCKISCENDPDITAKSATIDLSQIDSGKYNGKITIMVDSTDNSTLYTDSSIFDKVAHARIMLKGSYGDEGDCFEAPLDIF